jgi:hypothetical protein
MVAQTPRPVDVGTKVLCPQCRHVFTVADEPKPTEKREDRAGEDEEVGTYEFIQEKFEQPRIEHQPKGRIGSRRGTATTLVHSAANYLLLAGGVGAGGWFLLLTLMVMAAIFPLDESSDPKKQKQPEVVIGAVGSPTQMAAQARLAKKGAMPPLLVIWGVDLSGAKLAWYEFAFLLLLVLLGGVYSSFTTLGAVRMKNLESRDWGRIGGFLALCPIQAGGVMVLAALLIQFLFRCLGVDQETIDWLLVVVMLVVWLASLAAGLRAVNVLNKKKVIAGFRKPAKRPEGQAPGPPVVPEKK